MDVQVDESATRDYLLAFEKSVVESRAWAAMSAYNSINGVRHENDAGPRQLRIGFDASMSDWTASAA